MCTFDYPEHYNYLTKDQQESVLSWFNTTKDIERSIISTSVKSKSERELKAFFENRERYETQLRGAQSILRTMGVFVEYNWPGHEHEYFLATSADAERYRKEHE